MNDSELLEAAAKAAGIEPDKELAQLPDGLPAFWVLTPTPHWWRPLVDDGDALRLAVNLRLRIFWPQAVGHVAEYVAAGLQDSTSKFRADETIKGDPCSHTRRAIVRAAATLGQTLPPKTGA